MAGIAVGLDPLAKAQDEIEAIRRLVIRATETLAEADEAWKRMFREPAGNLSEEELSEWEIRERREREEERSRIGDERDFWRRVLRQAAISYYTTFETFLREFLAQQMESRLDLLQAALKQRLGLSLRVSLPVDHVELEKYIAKQCRRFEDIKGAYKACGLSGAWEWRPGGSVFQKKTLQQAALYDIELLRIMRNDLAHQGGQGGHTYRDEMRWTESPFQSRLKDFPTYVDSPPPPEEILRSPAIDGDGFENKLEEMGEAVRCYSEYIAEMCAGA
jgi:hypothetical protein